MCNVGNYPDEVKKHIREDVCQNLVASYAVDNAAYCVLHAPTLRKDTREFNRIFNERISRNEYNFQAVVFPVPLDFSHSNFTLPLNFRDATFLSSVGFCKVHLKYVYFDYAKFHGRAQFHQGWGLVTQSFIV